MFKLYFLLSVGLMLQVSRACDEENQLVRQQSDEYLASAYEFNPNLGMFHPMAYYESGARVPEFYASPYEGRTPLTRPTIQQSFKKQLNNRPEENNQPEGRFALSGLGANLINTGLFNNRFTPANTWRPFQNLANRIPVSYNPNFNNRPFTAFDACTSLSGDNGICVPGNICSLFGGRPSGSCVLGTVCCINAITTCGGTVTLNNTYWQSPSTLVSAPSTCALTVRMDTKLVEQLAKPICQIRLDFVSFSTTQPTAGTCTDTFAVGGSTSSVPIICGDNTGQHMYFDVPSSATTRTDIQLIFNFATGVITANRSWKIKIAMLPCGATYLAPPDCLQYFTAASGKVKSFNWQDVAGMTTRQLNNQNYNICFRTELVPSQRATQMCLSVCSMTNGGDAFSITTPTSTKAALAAAAVDDAKTNVANAQTTLTNANVVLAAANKNVDDETIKRDAAQVIRDAANDFNSAAPDAATAAQDKFDAAKTDLTDLITELQDAQNIYDAALAAVTTAGASVAEQQTLDLTNAKTELDKVQNKVDSAQTNFYNAKTILDEANQALIDAPIALAKADEDLASAKTSLASAVTLQTDAQGIANDAKDEVDKAKAELTAAQSIFDQAAAIAAVLSSVGASAVVNEGDTATCLYDYLLIAGARDSTNVVADRFCGNALNPATTPVAASVPVCTLIKPFRMTYQTDNTEEEVAADTNILPAPADTANTGFCLDYQEK